VLFFLIILIASILCDIHSGIPTAQAEHHKDCRLWKYDGRYIPYFKYTEYPEGKNNPSHVAAEINYYYSNYTKGSVGAIDKIINNADWLVKHATPHGNYSILYYDFPFAYGMEPPWRSNLAQGKALDALAKAYQLTNNITYLDTSKSLLNSFFVEVKDGGVTLKTPLDGWWYEQNARNNVKNASRVLNGMMSSLLDIHDYYDYLNDTSAKFLFDQGVLALKKTLPLYDDNGWSYYDIHKKPAKLSYHLMHIRLLSSLYNITGDKVFQQFRDKWQNFMITSDITPPHVVDINISGATSATKKLSIAIHFDDSLDKSSVNASTVMLRKSEMTEFCNRDDTVNGRITLKPDGRTVIFRPTEDLVPDSSYTVIITKAIQDRDGNTKGHHDASSFHTIPKN